MSKRDAIEEVREIQSMKETEPATAGEEPHGKLEKKRRCFLGTQPTPTNSQQRNRDISPRSDDLHPQGIEFRQQPT